MPRAPARGIRSPPLGEDHDRGRGDAVEAGRGGPRVGAHHGGDQEVAVGEGRQRQPACDHVDAVAGGTGERDGHPPARGAAGSGGVGGADRPVRLDAELRGGEHERVHVLGGDVRVRAVQSLVEVVPASVGAVARADDPGDERHGWRGDEAARLDDDPHVRRHGRERRADAAGQLAERRDGLVVRDGEAAAEVEQLEPDAVPCLQRAHEPQGGVDGPAPRLRRRGLAADMEREPADAQSCGEASLHERGGVLGRHAELRRQVGLRAGVRERQSHEDADVAAGEPGELADLRRAVDDERADAAEVRARDVGHRLHGVRVEAGPDGDAVTFEQVDLAARGDLERGAGRVHRVDDGRMRQRLRREVDAGAGQLAAELVDLRGDAGRVEHEERRAVGADEVVEPDAASVGGQVAADELPVRGAPARRAGIGASVAAVGALGGIARHARSRARAGEQAHRVTASSSAAADPAVRVRRVAAASARPSGRMTRRPSSNDAMAMT